MTGEGRVEPLTDGGAQLIEVCQLNRATLVAFRHRLQAAVMLLVSMNSSDAEAVLREVIVESSNQEVYIPISQRISVCHLGIAGKVKCPLCDSPLCDFRFAAS